MSEINTRIAAVIQASGLTKTAFAERVKVSQQHISRLAKDGTPSDRTIADICREFNVNEHWLRTGEGEMFSTLSREEEITKFAMEIIRDPDSEFQRQAISILAKLTPEQWKLMEQMGPAAVAGPPPVCLLFVFQIKYSAAVYRIRSCSSVACPSRRTICSIRLFLSSSLLIVRPPTDTLQMSSGLWRCAARSPRWAVCHLLPPL